MVLAPESELTDLLTTDSQRAEVTNYVQATKKKTERERIADRRVTGVFSVRMPSILSPKRLFRYG